MQEWMLAFVDNFGYLAIFLMIFIESIFPPIPSEAVSYTHLDVYKRQELCKILSGWQGAPIRLHMIHFTEIQKAIYANCDACLLYTSRCV